MTPGGGLSDDGSKWVSCKPNFFLPVRVLSKLFRRLFLDMLVTAHKAGRLKFFGKHEPLADKAAFTAFIKPLRKAEWVVYAKKPFGGPQAVLAYLSRYTHRIAISNRRLVKADMNNVTFKYKDYRIDGPERYKTMTLATHEFIRRFLSHVLPRGFHRIRHCGLLAYGNRKDNIARCRELLNVPKPKAKHDDGDATKDTEPETLAQPCPCCGGRMIVIKTFDAGCTPRHKPGAHSPEGIDSS